LTSLSTRFYFGDKFDEKDKFYKDLNGTFPAFVSSEEPGAQSATDLFRYAYNTNQLTVMKLGLERAAEVYDPVDGATEVQHKRFYEAGVPDEINYDVLKREVDQGAKNSFKDIYEQYLKQYEAYYRLAYGVSGFGTNLMIPNIMTDYYNTLQVAATGMASLPHYRNAFKVQLRPQIVTGYSFRLSDFVFEDTYQDQMMAMMAQMEDQEFMNSFTQERLHEDLLKKRQGPQIEHREYFQEISLGQSSVGETAELTIEDVEREYNAQKQ